MLQKSLARVKMGSMRSGGVINEERKMDSIRSMERENGVHEI